MLVLSAYIFNGPYATWKKDMSRPKNFITGFQASDIDKIETEKAGKKIAIEKVLVNTGSSTEEKWKISMTT